MLDFIFAAGPAQGWQGTSEIVVRANDFPDDAATSDHRSVKAIFTLPGGDEAIQTPMLLPLLRVAPPAQ